MVAMIEPDEPIGEYKLKEFDNKTLLELYAEDNTKLYDLRDNLESLGSLTQQQEEDLNAIMYFLDNTSSIEKQFGSVDI